MREWILPALGTFIFWGLWGFLPKITTRYISPGSAVFYESAIGIVVAVIVLGFLGFRPETHPVGVVLASITGVLGILGALTYLIAVKDARVSLVVTLTALYPILTILLARVILNEPIALRQGLGIFLALAAIVLLAS